MARTVYKGFDLPDGNAVPDVPADLRTLVDGIAPRYAPAVYASIGIAFSGSAGGQVNDLTIPAQTYARVVNVHAILRCDGNSGTGSSWFGQLKVNGAIVKEAHENGSAYGFTFQLAHVFTLAASASASVVVDVARNVGAGLVTGYADAKANHIQAMVFPTQLTV